MSACPWCDDPECDLVGCGPSPGDVRRAWLREHPDEQEAEPE